MRHKKRLSLTLDEAMSLSKQWATMASRRYGLPLQFDVSLLDDMIQSGILAFLESKGQNEKTCIWRGIHEEVRRMVYGGVANRTNRIYESSLDLEDLVENDMSIENQVDWLHAVEKIPDHSDQYRYFIEGSTLNEIASLTGVTESAVCLRLRSLRNALRA